MNKLRYVKPVKPKLSSPFCVDGRTGKREKNGQSITDAYPQMLGGSLNSVINHWILQNKEGTSLIEKAKKVFRLLVNNGFGLGLHIDEHSKDDKIKSGCGFADNLPKIIKYLREDHTDTIWQLLENNGLVSGQDKKAWNKVIGLVKQINLDNIPNGERIINSLRQEAGVGLQILKGDHRETKAIVDLKERYTLDTDNSQDTPAFDLDMWRVLDEARALSVNLQEVKLLTLGLYVATEIALVEDKGKNRLQIIINK